jgi:hypothetical protein
VKVIKTYSKPLSCFFIPFLVLAGLMVWTSFRISMPDGAMETARQYLEEKIPGAQWQLGKMMKVGEGLSKKWRLELSSTQKDGRMAQANLLIDRWRPGRVVGKFVMVFGPPQILEGGWQNPSYLDSLSNKIPRVAYLIAGGIFFGLQCFWLYWVRRRRAFFPRDGIILSVLGFGLLCNHLVLETHPGYLAAYALVISCIVWGLFSGERVNARP